MRVRLRQCARSLPFACVMLLTVACAGVVGPDSVNEVSSSLALTGSAASTAQGEIHSVIQTTQSAIMSGLLQTATGVALGKCKPTFALGLTGASLKFTRTDTCNLQGEVGVVFFPLGARVALDVYGMKYVEAMSFNANIVFKKESRGFEVGWQFINGKITLNNTKLFPVSQLGLNGNVGLSVNAAANTFGSRTNVYDPATGMGLSIISSFARDKASNQRTRKLDSCLLTGAVGNNPAAGTLGNCVALLK